MRKRRFNLGCIPDKFDRNDYLMRSFLKPKVKLPDKIDYTSVMSPIRNQGDFGACVAFASVSGMKEYQEQIDYGQYIELSPQFVYSECKKIDGISGEGTTIRAAMKVLSDIGVCKEKFYPYSPHTLVSPLIGYLVNAKKFKVKTYARILNLYELKLTLATKGPCVIGVNVFKDMMSTSTGIIKMPRRRERSSGGHALCAVGYCENTRLVKFKNSWGEEWGQRGYGYLPYDYIKKYMIDAWSSVDIDDPNPLTIGDVMDVVETANERVK